MSATISIEIPREVIHATRMTPQELKRDLAVFLVPTGQAILWQGPGDGWHDGVGLPTAAREPRDCCSL